MFLIAPFVFAYLVGGFGSGIYLAYQHLHSAPRKRTPWSILTGIGWFLFVGGFVIGLGVSPFVDLPQRPSEPTVLAAICNFSIMVSFAFWIAALAAYRTRERQTGS